MHARFLIILLFCSCRGIYTYTPTQNDRQRDAVVLSNERVSDAAVPRDAANDAVAADHRAADIGEADLSACPNADSEPQLTPLDATALEPARVAFNASCRECSLDKIAAYVVNASCAVDLDTVVASLVETGYWYHVGSYDRAALSSIMFFKGADSMLEAVDAYVGDTDVRAWEGEIEIQCPNCHQWMRLVVLLYPAVSRVVVLEGSEFWDS